MVTTATQPGLDGKAIDHRLPWQVDYSADERRTHHVNELSKLLPRDFVRVELTELWYGALTGTSRDSGGRGRERGGHSLLPPRARSASQTSGRGRRRLGGATGHHGDRTHRATRSGEKVEGGSLFMYTLYHHAVMNYMLPVSGGRKRRRCPSRTNSLEVI